MASKMSEEFQKEFNGWQFEVESSFPMWAQKLADEAKKQSSTYGAAKRWLNSQKPDLTGQLTGTPQEQFYVLLRAIFDDARIILQKEQDKINIED